MADLTRTELHAAIRAAEATVAEETLALEAAEAALNENDSIAAQPTLLLNRSHAERDRRLAVRALHQLFQDVRALNRLER